MKRRLAALWGFLAVFAAVLLPSMALAVADDPFRNGWNVYISGVDGCGSYSWGGANLDELTVSLSDASGCSIKTAQYRLRPYENFTVLSGGKLYLTAEVFITQVSTNSWNKPSVENQTTSGAIAGPFQDPHSYILGADGSKTALGSSWPVGSWFTLLMEWDASKITANVGQTVPIQVTMTKSGKHTMTIRHPVLTYQDPAAAVPAPPSFFGQWGEDGITQSGMYYEFAANAGTESVTLQMWAEDDTYMSDVYTATFPASQGDQFIDEPTEWALYKKAGWYRQRIWATNAQGDSAAVERRFQYKPASAQPITDYPTWDADTSAALDRPDGPHLSDMWVGVIAPNVGDVSGAVEFTFTDQVDGASFTRTVATAPGNDVQTKPDDGWLIGRDGHMIEVQARGVNEYWGEYGPSISAVFQYDPVREVPPEEVGLSIEPYIVGGEWSGGLFETTNARETFVAHFKGSAFMGGTYRILLNGDVVESGPVPAPVTGLQESSKSVAVNLDYGRHRLQVEVIGSDGRSLGISPELPVERSTGQFGGPGSGLPPMDGGGNFLELLGQYLGWFTSLFRLFPAEMSALMLFGLSIALGLRVLGR